MLRRTVRLRKEYLFRKATEEKARVLADRKKRLKEALESGKPVPTDLRGEAGQKLLPTLDLEDVNTAQTTSHIDDEYAYAGVEDPKVVLTTSRNPSSRLQQFVKELRLLIPNSQRINRGGYVVNDLVELCRSNSVTDLIIIHEHRGQPDAMVVCHLPHGPAAHFNLSGVALRHDLPEKPANMSEAAPHLVFHNFTSRVDEENSAEKRGRLELVEVGPRFTLKPYRIDLGTAEMKDVETEWAVRPFFNKPKAALTE
ncbi:putative U3 small nucleolar ribonucleoprotein protein [Neospora caninum Liverpool]|uniref:Putative U3 small nucleolar ribonucleoprotein protein n=1 Tax=Neospora caninum (strain Liverpool) TaxID=572307 RepID=F0VMS5_NEOCL|nr:putative U3 small nucleolar ribonucleoprotein protein [Neospora caninum Liverpool]CBZ55021.1 putative U3 small nucleolar ribonucleoprotein protein [Neospora caninum Liverpool]|eukprot:XP_003885049.1 putative U3 small nucleolar ribonucleoprotein protein [Neospora caninum Liverpool]